MYDLNFFESFSPKGKHTASLFRSNMILIGILAAILAIWPIFNQAYSYKLEGDIAKLQAEVEKSEKYKLIEQTAALREYILERGNQLKVLQRKDKELQADEWLNEAFLYNLMSTAPKDLRFEKLAITPEKTISIEGAASNKPAIAELERSLRSSGRFSILHVQTIDRKEGTYQFVMNLELKGGNENAAD